MKKIYSVPVSALPPHIFAPKEWNINTQKGRGDMQDGNIKKQSEPGGHWDEIESKSVWKCLLLLCPFAVWELRPSVAKSPEVARKPGNRFIFLKM